jgi:hypothetical protein
MSVTETPIPATADTVKVPANFVRRHFGWFILPGLIVLSMAWAKLSGYPALLGLEVLGFLFLVFGQPILAALAVLLVSISARKRTGSRWMGWAAGAVVAVLCVAVYFGERQMPVIGPLLIQAEHQLATDTD